MDNKNLDIKILITNFYKNESFYYDFYNKKYF